MPKDLLKRLLQDHNIYVKRHEYFRIGFSTVLPSVLPSTYTPSWLMDSVCLSVYQAVCHSLSSCLPIYLLPSLCQFHTFCLSVCHCPLIRPSFHPIIWSLLHLRNLSATLPVHLSFRPAIRVYVYMYFCVRMYIYLSASPYVCLSIYLPVFISLS
jgi:hypothetical protein